MASPTFAVVVRTHFWDAFIERQVKRLAPHIGGGKLFVLADVTRGDLDVTSDLEIEVVKVTDGDLLALGYPQPSSGSLQWISGDAPLYLLRDKHPMFDYYVQLEYDVNIDFDLSDLVRRVSAEHVDFVALTKGDEHGEKLEQWPWLDSMLDFYQPNTIGHQLICLAVFSNAAITAFAASRARQAAALANNPKVRWPMCEGFLTSEARSLGLTTRELSDYVDTSRYDWYPPYTEAEGKKPGHNAVMHPVLDRSRYTSAYFKHEPSLSGLLNPIGWRHRKLRRLGFPQYVATLASNEYREAVRAAWSRRAGER